VERVQSLRLTVGAQSPLEDLTTAIEYGGHVDGAGRSDAVQRVRSVRPARPVDACCAQWKGTMAIFVWGLINSPLAGFGWSLAPLGLNIHTLEVLGEPLTYLFLLDCESISEWF
jgi:hypothetical protein